MNGYIFSGIMEEDRLKQLIRNYFFGSDVFYIIHDTIHYNINDGVPSDLSSEGRVFSEAGEIRWKKKADRRYFVSILSEHETGIPGELKKAELELEVRGEDSIFLTDPKKARHISPPFDSYPRGAKRVKVSYYMHKGMIVLTRLKRFE